MTVQQSRHDLIIELREAAHVYDLLTKAADALESPKVYTVSEQAIDASVEALERNRIGVPISREKVRTCLEAALPFLGAVAAQGTQP